MEERGDDPSAPDWKRRYREQIAELDRLEADWGASDRVMRRAIGRLARCAAGQNDALDEAIDTLQQGLRDDLPADALSELVDRLSAPLLAEHDDQTEAITAENHAPRSDIAPRSPDDELTAARRPLLLLLDRLAAADTDAAVAPLRQRLQEAESERSLMQAIDAVADHLTADSSRSGDDHAMPNTDGAPGETPAVLLRLLEQITVPEDFGPSIERVRSHLETATGGTDWSGVVAEIAELINAVRTHLQQQQRDLTQLVEHIGGRIEMLAALLEEQSGSLQHQAHQGEVFDQDMGNHMRSLSDDVGAATDLEQVKESVDQRIDRMSEQLRRHREQDRQRIEDARARFGQMQERLTQLEQESGQLREAVRRKEEEALVDPLTGIANRGGYERRMAEEFQRWQRFGTPLSLALFDIDHFKRINDEFGHRAGDKALRVIAQLLAQRLRRIDFIARYGGEEFIALLPGTSAEAALAVVDQLRARVAASGFHFRGTPVAISLTAGVTAFAMDDTIGSAVDRADGALYAGKSAGRDRCILHAPPDAGD